MENLLKSLAIRYFEAGRHPNVHLGCMTTQLIAELQRINNPVSPLRQEYQAKLLYMAGSCGERHFSIEVSDGIYRVVDEDHNTAFVYFAESEAPDCISFVRRAHPTQSRDLVGVRIHIGPEENMRSLFIRRFLLQNPHELPKISAENNPHLFNIIGPIFFDVV